MDVGLVLRPSWPGAGGFKQEASHRPTSFLPWSQRSSEDPVNLPPLPSPAAGSPLGPSLATSPHPTPTSTWFLAALDSWCLGRESLGCTADVHPGRKGGPLPQAGGRAGGSQCAFPCPWDQASWLC